MITELLKERGVPASVAHYIEKINTSVIKLPAELKLDESLNLRKKETVEELAKYNTAIQEEISKHLAEHAKSIGNPTGSIVNHQPDLIGGVISVGGKVDQDLYYRVKKLSQWNEKFRSLHPINIQTESRVKYRKSEQCIHPDTGICYLCIREETETNR